MGDPNLQDKFVKSGVCCWMSSKVYYREIFDVCMPAYLILKLLRLIGLKSKHNLTKYPSKNKL